MVEPRQTIPYAAPEPRERKPTPRIVWWFLADFGLFFIAIALAGAFHQSVHKSPTDKPPPPWVDWLLMGIMLPALALLGILVCCVLAGMFRRWWRGGPL